jgi:hypothetical protein
MVERVRGSFGLVAWDGERGIVARDHLGARPVFVASDSGRVAFSSDPELSLAALGRRREPREAAVLRALAGETLPAGATLLEGVDRLGPGRCLLLRGEDHAERRYWEPRYRPPARGDTDELAHTIRGAVEQAVGRWAGDPSSTAVSLSGGLDSSMVAASLAEATGDGQTRQLRAFSAAFPRHPETDESEYIGAMARALPFETTVFEVRSGSPLRGALEHLRDCHFPAISPNHFFWQPMVARMAREGVEIVLDGEGGDELFGVSPYLLADRIRHGRIASAARLAGQVPMPPGTGWRDHVKVLVQCGLKPALSPRVQRALSGRTPAYGPPWFTDASARAFADADDPWAWLRSGPRWWSHLASTLTEGRDGVGVRDYCRRRDADVGLESRHPLLDDLDLVELILQVDPSASFADDERPLLRAALPPLVPDDIRFREDKRFFNAMFNDLLLKNDWPAVEALLGSPDAAIYAYLRPDVLRERLLDRRPGGSGTAYQRAKWGGDLWNILIIECWLRSLEDPGFAEDALERFGLAELDWRVRSSRTAVPT